MVAMGGYTFTILIFTERCPTRVKRAQHPSLYDVLMLRYGLLYDCMVARVL